MFLIDMFLSEEQRIGRHARRLANRDSQAEDREASAKYLAEKATPGAVLGLFARFDLNLEHQLKDSGEKEKVYELILSLGEEKVLASAKQFLRVGKQITLPLKLVRDMVGTERALEIAFEVLDAEGKKQDFKADRKKQLLIWLSDQRDARICEAAAPMLRDFDEGVRFVAVEVILAQKDDAAQRPLFEALRNLEEESNRLKIRICQAAEQRNWKVTEDEEGMAKALPDGWILKGGRIAPRK